MRILVQRIRLRRQVAGRLFVQTKKTKDPERGWLGISISADATAVVKKDSVTHVIRARPRQGGGWTADHKPRAKKAGDRGRPRGRPIKVTVADKGALWRALMETPQKRGREGREAYLDLETGEVIYTCEKHLHPTRLWAVSGPCEPKEKRNLEDVQGDPERYLRIPALQQPLQWRKTPGGLLGEEHRRQIRDAIAQWLDEVKRDRNIRFSNEAAILDWEVD